MQGIAGVDFERLERGDGAGTAVFEILGAEGDRVAADDEAGVEEEIGRAHV